MSAAASILLRNGDCLADGDSCRPGVVACLLDGESLRSSNGVPLNLLDGDSYRIGVVGFCLGLDDGDS